MQSRTKTSLQNAVKQVFSKLENYAPYQSDEDVRTTAGGPSLSPAERRREIEKKWEKYEGYVDLNAPFINYKKVPFDQEASVVAIFHELIGAGKLSSYFSYNSGYSTRYDLYAKYRKEDGEELKIVIEFKYRLESIINDLENDIKYLEDIDLLVAWDANSQKLRDSNLYLEEVGQDIIFDGVTHILSSSSPYADKEIILLKDFLRDMKS